MRITKGLALALAAAILTSGSGMAASGLTAAPAQAATVGPGTAVAAAAETILPPPFFVGWAQTDQVGLYWMDPNGYRNFKVLNYTVTVKQQGRPDRVFHTASRLDDHFIATGLTQNTTYTFEVRTNAVSLDGKRRITSAPHSETATTSSIPAHHVKAATPSALALSATPGSITASWNAPAVTGTLTGYTVNIKRGSKTVKSYTTTTRKITATGLTEKTNYTVQVKANAISRDKKHKASSAYATKTIGTTLSASSTVKAGKPAALKATAAATSLKVSWKRPAITGRLKNYTVQLKQGSKTLKSYTTASPAQTITGLKRNTSYTVQVRANAKSTNGKYLASSAYVSVSVKTKR